MKERGNTNVTLSLPDELLREARHLAVDQGLSLSRFLARCLEERLHERREFVTARERSLRMMREGLHLGMPERPSWTRDDLHER